MFIDIEEWPWQPAPAVAERPLFAIGDVHGRCNLLIALLGAIRDRVTADNLTNALAVLLGDYVDRGPRSIPALKAALEPDSSEALSIIPLPGNHEQFLLAFLAEIADQEVALLRWFKIGGDAVAIELGWRSRDALADPVSFQRVVRNALGTALLERLKALPSHYRSCHYLFVHAGIHPRLGLGTLDVNWRLPFYGVSTEDRHPLWIRGPFLTHVGSFEENVIVVHGHTPNDDPELLPNRINLDTRAYESGRLTAVQILGDQMRIIQAVGDRREKAMGWP